MNEQLAGLSPAQRDVFRLTGVVAFAAGAMALFIRKSSQDQWAAFPKLLVLAIPCVLLYGLGTGDLRIGREDDTPADARRVPAWRAAALVLGLILVPLTLAQLVDTFGGDPNKSGHTFWTFAVTAAAGWYAAFARGLRWGALFAGLALIISWIALCDALFDPSPTGFRWLFIIVGVALAAAAVTVDRDGEREGPELVTAAGVAALIAGVIGLVVVFGQVVAGAVATAFGGDPDLSGAEQHQEWDVFLLVVALLLIWYGLRAAWRGPVYIGALTLFAFILSVGTEITSLFDDGPSGDLVGWPLLLLVLGGGALLVGLYGGGGTGTPAQPATGAGGDAPTQPLPPQPPPGSPPPGQP
jgi:hypothetical protein